jgi:serine/threonine-protein kinase HipA
VAELLRAAVAEYRDGMPGAAAGRFSLAGAQPKIALLREADGTWAVPKGSTPTTHIIKPVWGAFPRLDVVEHLTTRAAALLGLDAAHTWIESFDSVQALVTERYDRARRRRRLVRLHQEDLGQALSVPPEKKYQQQDGGPGVAEVGRLLRTMPLLPDRHDAALAFYEGLMFNVLLHCTDAHIKNYSVMLEGNSVRLAPLYDLASYAPYGDRPGQANSAMRIGAHYRFASIGEADCLQAATQLSLSPDESVPVLRRLKTNAVGAFEAARDELAGQDSVTKAFASQALNAVAALSSLR